MKKWLLIAAPVLFVCDFLLKKFVIAFAPEILSGQLHFHFNLLPFIHFDLAYIENKGMAWGMFASFQTIILFLRSFVIGAIIVGLIKSKAMRVHMTAFLFIVLGAFANVLDTIMYGHVVDMMSFTFWGRSYGIFNMADAMIFIGAMMMIFTRKNSYVTE